MTVSSRAFAAMLKAGPPVTREVTVERDVPVRATDGADLLTDVYMARAREPLPVILMRTPYGRRGPYGTIARLFAEERLLNEDATYRSFVTVVPYRLLPGVF